MANQQRTLRDHAQRPALGDMQSTQRGHRVTCTYTHPPTRTHCHAHTHALSRFFPRTSNGGTESGINGRKASCVIESAKAEVGQVDQRSNCDTDVLSVKVDDPVPVRGRCRRKNLLPPLLLLLLLLLPLMSSSSDANGIASVMTKKAVMANLSNTADQSRARKRHELIETPRLIAR